MAPSQVAIEAKKLTFALFATTVNLPVKRPRNLGQNRLNSVMMRLCDGRKLVKEMAQRLVLTGSGLQRSRSPQIILDLFSRSPSSQGGDSIAFN